MNIIDMICHEQGIAPNVKTSRIDLYGHFDSANIKRQFLTTRQDSSVMSESFPHS